MKKYINIKMNIHCTNTKMYILIHWLIVKTCSLSLNYHKPVFIVYSLPCSTTATARHDNYHDRTTSSSWFDTTFHWNPMSHHVSIMQSRHSHLNSLWNRIIRLDCLYLYGFSGVIYIVSYQIPGTIVAVLVW